MQRLEASGAVRHVYIYIYISLGGKWLIKFHVMGPKIIGVKHLITFQQFVPSQWSKDGAAFAAEVFAQITIT
jgi:hypothetical protein